MTKRSPAIICSSRFLVFAAIAVASAVAWAGDTTPAAQLSYWQMQAGGTASADRGKTLFVARHGDMSCAGCHGQPPTGEGKHSVTGKAIQPLAPAYNTQRFTDTAKVDKWFKRNCRDVLGRECTAQEKADVLAYLVSIK